MPTFQLDMPNVVLSDGREFDLISIKWTEKMSTEKLKEATSAWLREPFFLCNRMPDLLKVGESSLKIG